MLTAENAIRTGLSMSAIDCSGSARARRGTTNAFVMLASVLRTALAATPWVKLGPSLATTAIAVSSGSSRLNGKIEMKSGALPSFGYDIDFARMQFEYALGDGESQPH